MTKEKDMRAITTALAAIMLVTTVGIKEAKALRSCQIRPYATAATLTARSDKDCTIAYSHDTDVFYFRIGGSWTAWSSPLILTGTNGGTFSNATDNMWDLSESGETLRFNMASDTDLVLSSSTGLVTLQTAFDLSLAGGAGAVQFTDSASSIVTPANDTTALLIGPAAQPGLLTIDSGTATETVIVNGTTSVEAFKVAVGTSTFSEAATVTGDLTLNGGVGALDFSATASSSMLVEDASAAGFDIGAAGATDILRIVSTDASPGIIVKGINGQTAFQLDVGNMVIDEGTTLTGDVDLGGGAEALEFTAANSSILAPDNSATALVVGGATVPALLTVNTQTGVDRLVIDGTTATDVFHVDEGTAQFDENVDVTGGVDITGALDVSTTSNLQGDVTLGGGAGALTTSADGTASHVAADADSTAFVWGAAGATAVMTLDTTDGAEQVLFTGSRTESLAVTGAVTYDGGHCGKTMFVADAADADAQDLPATIAGCELTFMFAGSDGGALVDISPNASDAIHGSCYEEAGDTLTQFNGTDDNDVGLTKATANTGDYIKLIGDGSVGWFVQGCIGIWVNN
jgi:hypothetical protein